jgi:hypothetical protein
MSIDVDAAVAFVAGNGRVLDRRRLDLMLHGDAPSVLPALDAYRNPDGGYGWGIEPDLRAPESQPVGAMHALEVVAEVAEAGGDAGDRGLELCEWLDQHTLPGGALPFTLPISRPAGCAEIWLGGDHTTASLQMTAQVAANAHRLAAHDPRIAGHPWLAKATRWTYDAIVRLQAPHAYELLFTIRFLDTVAGDAEAASLLDDVRRFLPPGGAVPVEGGTPDETLHPLDFAARAGGAARRLFSSEAVAADLDRLARRQQPDGGWTVDYASASPAAALEWRGYATVAAVGILHHPPVGRTE